ncbi:Protein PAT1 1 [Ataeniobius toweri]|uniref:Protein PAT1 1 n=2 Tax=Goodeidae TaxID=28758 RepID=A0ABU7ARJ7_9TELE|nr:Protein PAT1 1 [Ataeniobius toweri]
MQFGMTLLYLILSEGERMQSSDPNCQLMDDNRWTELVFSVTRELLSIPSSSLSPPLFTPPNLLSLFSRYVDRQRLELLQDKLQISASSRFMEPEAQEERREPDCCSVLQSLLLICFGNHGLRVQKKRVGVPA